MKGCLCLFLQQRTRSSFCQSAGRAYSVASKEDSKEMFKQTLTSGSLASGPRVESDVNDNVKYIDYLPLYSIKAACGTFGEGQYDEGEQGWVKGRWLGEAKQKHVHYPSQRQLYGAPNF